ncbi:MAG: YggS family pyridoxal phosphate-dependent enzyme [Candidatus Omnitrophica bacterium]|nr:YggS family pyridoxal phosphate-dependent enzyme [Candidatus Omnitrophota bacterium]
MPPGSQSRWRRGIPTPPFINPKIPATLGSSDNGGSDGSVVRKGDPKPTYCIIPDPTPAPEKVRGTFSALRSTRYFSQSLTLASRCVRVPGVSSPDGLRDRLDLVRQRMQAAARRSGRPETAVTLVGVAKGISAEAVREAVRLGLADVGENRVQEARVKRAALGDRQAARWHLIGHLQRNKAKLALELFDVIHSVDSWALVETLNRLSQARPKPLDVLIQVNVSGEPAKFGCRPEDAAGLARAVQRSTALTLRGFMTIAPFVDNPEDVRPHFRRLRQLRDEVLAACGLPPAAGQLSMGMSQDFEVAIEEGADLVRVGTAIFGTGDKGQGTWASCAG